ncbi:hypothetical protein QY97_03908 [Bacillus thermotolerans]|nr:hypothetical protein QY97_03908 [Bacillus thermotolerans]KKB39351.1 hypothetical protein QY96_02853 [Bacillus thermotolerans]
MSKTFPFSPFAENYRQSYLLFYHEITHSATLFEGLRQRNVFSRE